MSHLHHHHQQQQLHAPSSPTTIMLAPPPLPPDVHHRSQASRNDPSPPPPPLSPSSPDHPAPLCPLCFKEFPSSRSLGGHMRIHGGLLHGSAAHPLYPSPFPSLQPIHAASGMDGFPRISDAADSTFTLCQDMGAAATATEEKKAPVDDGSSSSGGGCVGDESQLHGYHYGGSDEGRGEYLTTDQIPAKPRFKVMDSLMRSGRQGHGTDHVKQPVQDPQSPWRSCHICSKTFFSQHALSGHMRSHGGGGPAHRRSSPRQATPPVSTDQSRTRIKFVYKLPPAEAAGSAAEAADSGDVGNRNMVIATLPTEQRPSAPPSPPPPPLLKVKSRSSNRRRRCPSLFFQLHSRTSLDINVGEAGVDAPTSVEDSAARSLLMLRAAITDAGLAHLSSPQVSFLGGHRASHNKVTGGGDCGGGGLQFMRSVAADHHLWQESCGSLIHPDCPICCGDGQAMGGHKRCRWWGYGRSTAAALYHDTVNIPRTPSIAKQQSPPSTGAARGGRNVIDLNLPPVETPPSPPSDAAATTDVASWEAAVGDARKRLRLLAGEPDEDDGQLGLLQQPGQGWGIYSDSGMKAWEASRRRHLIMR